MAAHRKVLAKKRPGGKPLSRDESERAIGIESLIKQLENMIQESGNPTGFDAAEWLASWLKSPLPALGNKTPASYLGTIEGQTLVSRLLTITQSGAYA